MRESGALPSAASCCQLLPDWQMPQAASCGLMRESGALPSAAVCCQLLPVAARLADATSCLLRPDAGVRALPSAASYCQLLPDWQIAVRGSRTLAAGTDAKSDSILVIFHSHAKVDRTSISD